MDVVIADTLGFCGGVRAALDLAMKAVAEAERLSVPCYMYGSIVHNRLVSKTFVDLSVRVIDSPEGFEPGILIIRTHGIADSLRALFEKKGFRIADATCPVVLRNMDLLRSCGGEAVIIGKEGHSEIISLSGCRPGVPVISSPGDLLSLSSGSYKAVVQTTFSLSSLEEILHAAEGLGISFSMLNTICKASELRRDALLRMLGRVEAVVVAGDVESANSRELADMARAHGVKAYLALDGSSLPDEVFCYNSIGLTAGASSPDDAVEEIRSVLESHDRSK